VPHLRGRGCSFRSRGVPTVARENLIYLYDLPRYALSEGVNIHCAACMYDNLCRLCFRYSAWLGGVKEIEEGYRRHSAARQIYCTYSPTRRIVRVEVVAQVRTLVSPPSFTLHHSGFRIIHLLIPGHRRDPQIGSIGRPSSFLNPVAFSTSFSVTLCERLAKARKTRTWLV
jgi:hypothetical protein